MKKPLCRNEKDDLVNYQRPSWWLIAIMIIILLATCVLMNWLHTPVGVGASANVSGNVSDPEPLPDPDPSNGEKDNGNGGGMLLGGGMPSCNYTQVTIYPDAHPETDTVDGWLAHNYAVGSGVDWAVIQGQTGNLHNDSSTDVYIGFHSDTVQDKWRIIYRSDLIFDTAPIPDDAVLISAMIQIYGYSKGDPHGALPDSNIFSATTLFDNDLHNLDYNDLGTTAFSSAIAYGDWSTIGYNDFELNGTGLAYIELADVTKFGWRNVNYDVDIVAPPYVVGNQGSYLAGYAADKDGSYRPRLVICYSVEPDCPSDLTLTALGGETVNVSWTKASQTDNTLLRIERNDIPDSITDGEYIYFGSGSSVNITGLSLDTTNYGISAWSQNPWGYSSCYDTGQIGGEELQDTVVMMLPVGLGVALMAINIFLKKPLIYLFIIPCMLAIVFEPEFDNAWVDVSAIGVACWCALSIVVRTGKGVEG